MSSLSILFVEVDNSCVRLTERAYFELCFNLPNTCTMLYSKQEIPSLVFTWFVLF